MNPHKIRGFLLQAPKPTTVRVTCNGETEEIKPSPRSYAKTAETIAALQPELIECLDAQGSILRAMRPESSESRRSDAAEIPVGLAADPHAMMISHFANLIHRAYEHSTEIAFGRLVELADRLNDRAEMIEQRLERSEALSRRLVNEQIDDAFARADEVIEQAQQQGGNSAEEQLIAAFLSGRAQRAARKPNGVKAPKTNGVA